MKLTTQKIKHIAKLANLALDDDEQNKYFEQLSKILEYVEQLDQDNTNLESTFNTTSLNNVFRIDQTASCLGQKEALRNAPKQKEGFFVTEGIFDND